MKFFHKSKTDTLPDYFLENFPQDSRFSESYRSLRTNVNFSFMDKPLKSLLVTSAGAEEGKSITTANLAHTMAQAGKTVLMIDADLRKPMLSRLVSDHGSIGVSGLLSGVFSTDVQAGSLSDFSISDLLRLVMFQKKTGVLDLSDASETIRIYFLAGELTDVQWVTRPADKKLAALLVRDGVINETQAQQALTRAQNTGQKMGFVLINMGLVRENQLAGYITLHMMEGLRIALQFKSGRFSFESLPESSFEQSSYDPADLPQLYHQAIIGEENLHFLQTNIADAIVPTATENLFLLPTGPRPPQPAEMLASDRMSFLLSYVKRRFDLVIIDSPPVLVTTDALLIAKQTDGVLLVVRAAYLKREAVKKTVDQIQRTQANLIGVALNQVDIDRESYYKYKYYSKYYREER